MAQNGELRRLHDEAVAAQEAGDYMRLLRIAGDLAAAADGSGDELEGAWARYFSGAASFQRNDGTAASRAYRDAQKRFEAIDDREGAVRAALGLAAVALDIELDTAEARHIYDRALPIVRELGDKRRLAIVLGNLGEICRIEGNSSDALRWSAESIELFLGLGEHCLAGSEMANSAHYHFLLRDYRAALADLHEGYSEMIKEPIPRWVSWYYDIAFIIAAGLERWEVAAQILGFIDHYRDQNGAPRLQGLLPWFSAPRERVSEHLGYDALHDLMEHGETLTIEQVHALVETLSPS